LTNNETKRLIQKYIKWWVHWLGLGYQSIKVSYVDYWEDGRECVALCDTDWRYMDSTLTFNLTKLRNVSESEIEMTVVHELAHIFLNEMREEGIDHEERVATMLQKAFMWVKGATK